MKPSSPVRLVCASPVRCDENTSLRSLKGRGRVFLSLMDGVFFVSSLNLKENEK